MRAESEDPRHTPNLEGTRTEDGMARFSSPGDEQWIARARDAYTASTDWFNASLRKKAEENLAHFRSVHKPGSKYNSELYQKKSRVFRPKTRSMVRRSDAAMAIAFFSTQDMVNCSAVNPSRHEQVLAGEVHTALLNWRLENTIPWYMICVGGSQDAAVQGVVISRQYWDRKTRQQMYADVYEEEDGTTTVDQSSEEVVIADKPCVSLVALENLRLDPACDWTNPIDSSPYLIELCPMYIHEVRENMMRVNPRTGRPLYRYYDAGVLQAALQQDWDSIRKMRDGQRVDKYQNDVAIDDYKIVWVHKAFYRVDGEDWYCETLGTEMVLTDPELAAEVFPHLDPGERPYSMGYASIEAHMAYPSSPVDMTSGVQEEINDVANLRLDNVKLALNRRWFVRRGQGVDVTTLIRNVPGAAVMMGNVEQDVREVSTPDVTRSSYEEQNRLSMEFDELGGNFSAASIGSNRQLNETVGGMTLLSSDASQIQEFQVRTVAETWVQRVMRQLVRLEATYETDDEVLDVVAATAALPLEMVKQVLGLKTQVRVNVGFSSTQPEKRIGKLLLGADALNRMDPTIMQKADRMEIVKEVFGALGYRDGARFFPDIAGGQEDPRVKQLEEQVQQLTQMLQGRTAETKMRVDGMVEVAKINSQTKLEIAGLQGRIQAAELRLAEIDRMIAGEQEDTKRKELYLQREALSHSISDDNRNFILKLHQAMQPKEAPKGGQNGGQKALPAKSAGAMNLAGNDKAGVISRGNFGEIPQNSM